MRLQRRFVLGIGFLLVVVGLVISAVTFRATCLEADNFEFAEANRVWSSARDTLGDEVERLHGRAVDWAEWDDTYDFMQSHSQRYVRSNISPTLLAELQSDVLLFLKADGSTVLQRSAPGFDVKHLKQRLHAMPGERLRLKPRFGLMMIGDQLVAVSVRPVMNTAKSKSPNGLVILARALTQERIRRIGMRLGAKLTIQSAESKAHAPAKSEAVVMLSGLLTDIDGRQSILLRSAAPRRYAQFVDRMGAFFIGNFALVGLGLLIVTSLVANKLFFSRFGELRRQLLVADPKRGGGQISIAGSDEVTAVASAVDELLLQVAENSELANRHYKIDFLTGLPNRRYFEQYLDDTLAEGEAVGLFFIDLDNFKLINDTHGHAFGDSLLQAAANKLRSVVGHGFVARLGGDEFTLVMPKVKGDRHMQMIAESLVTVLNSELLINGREMFLCASVGAALSTPGQNRSDLMRHADTALYEAKARGKGTWSQFDESLESKAQRRAQLEFGLRSALDNEELFLVYQPIVDLTTGKPKSLESLIRWNHSSLGPVSPAEFIPIAEETGLIVPIGLWVLETAMKSASRWPRHVKVNINLSQRQLQWPDLLSAVANALRKTSMDPDRVVFEVTESMVMENSEHSLGVMRDLKKLGVSLALDDFGTGYSSLSYLQKLPVDAVKIDRSFVKLISTPEEPTPILLAITTLCDAMGLAVTGEGIETEEQNKRLKELGCASGQGYLYSKPMKEEAVPMYVQAGWLKSRVA